jgi:hypothetical protein
MPQHATPLSLFSELRVRIHCLHYRSHPSLLPNLYRSQAARPASRPSPAMYSTPLVRALR